MKDDINRYLKYALVILLIYLAFLVVKPYLAVVIGGLILAFMVYPIQKRLTKLVKNKTIAAALITGLLILIVIIPLVTLANLLVAEATELYKATDIDTLKTTVFSTLNIEFNENMQSYIEDTLQSAANWFLGEASAFLLSIPEKIISLLILIFVIFYALRDGRKVVDKAMQLLPMDTHHKDRLEKKLGSTIKSLFYGEIAISVLEAIVAAAGFWLLGVKAPIIWGIVVGLVALLPGIGPTFIWGPMALIYFFLGDTTTGILIFLFGFIILSISLDTIARAKILGMKGHIHPLIILIGVLGGLSVFGIIGLILGPLILVILEMVAEIYLEMKHEA